MKRFLKLFIYTVLVIFLISPLFITVPANPITPQEYILEFDVPGGSFITIDDYTTYYIERNPRGEETILLVHGFGGSATNWLPVMQGLADEGYRVIALDLMGFGLSEKDLTRDYTHQGQVEFLNSFITELGLRDVNLVGHSMGSNIVTMYAQEYPENVRNLILVSAAVVEKQDIDVFRSRVLRLLDYPLIKDYATIFFNLSMTPDRLSGIFESAMYNPDSIEISEPLFLNPTSFENWGYALIKITVASEHNFLRHPLGDIDLPVLIIWGQEDTWIPLAQGEYLEGNIQDSKLKKLKNTGHLPMIEDPEKFNELLFEFLNR